MAEEAKQAEEAATKAIEEKDTNAVSDKTATIPFTTLRAEQFHSDVKDIKHTQAEAATEEGKEQAGVEYSQVEASVPRNRR